MSIVKGTEKIVNPLQESALNKKGLCDYVVNVASGCTHGCTFCYVPSTPVIRARQKHFHDKGIDNPQMDWGDYLLIRNEIPSKLKGILNRKRKWRETEAGKGVVLLCSDTDPYQNKQTSEITCATVKTLIQYQKKVRILTRSPKWIDDLDILVDKNVTVGMSLPYLNDSLSRKIEPKAPLPSTRYLALKKGKEAGCRIYVAIAPTHPYFKLDDFKRHLEKIMLLEPEVIFWEPINARGTNGKRMLAAGLDFVKSVMKKDEWANNFIQQWQLIEAAANDVGCEKILHVWPDRELEGYVDQQILENWWYRPTVEKWS